MFYIIFEVSILIQPQLFLPWIHVVFGWWMLGTGFLSMVDCYINLHDHLPGAPGSFLTGLISITLALFMILGHNMSIKTNVLSVIAGVYFILYGIIGLLFHISLIIHSNQPGIHSWSYSTPVFMNAFMPLRFYNSIHELKLASRLEVKKEEIPTDLHVYIYLKGKGPEMFGHIDISYKGTIWSYGNHDPKTRRLLGTYGDGVLIKADEKRFLQESIGTDGKTVICYGIRITEEQGKLIENRIAGLMKRAVRWKCDAEIAHDRGKDMSSCRDYASRVYKETFCEMYKFTKGKYRTYFISSTNCVMIADELIRNPDLHLIDLNGIVTPGSYLSFLNTEYLKPDSIVVSRTLYESGVREAIPQPE